MKFNQAWTEEEVPLEPSDWILREYSSSNDLHTGEHDSNNEATLKPSTEGPKTANDDHPDVIRLEIIDFFSSVEEIKEMETSPTTT